MLGSFILAMKKNLLLAKLSLYFIIPIVLILLPANYFDNGINTCLSMILLNKECPACGMTRAIMHLIHFEFDMAYYYNVMSFVVFPILALIWLYWFRNDLIKYKSL